ncbi:rap GTPase-activating protein, putative [Entamoeba invadens IP1]|uniref:Rap GTPase-activating protein, putative n=1 Tax=Entamoeba invadens IP1 TaxID=370355 RepID=A0A0A1U906_ENTIV|nr:rap GTPase-activating protein, putative [Entamoeba invadens IP1]ELP91369.1 rap GTPase-activating protein, putative [Entamoeba invadens IP1]|eukprot:XP_004258140.1 rap GTPase-activating protein, putative [Entamoeba invadens IP1]
MIPTDSFVTIAVRIYSARNLPKADPTGLSDPYVVLTYTSFEKDRLTKKKKKTETVKTSLSPIWNDAFVLNNVTPESFLIFNCFDWDNALKFSADDFLGKFKIMAERIPINKNIVWRVPLKDNDKSAGEITFSTYAVPSSQYIDTKENKKSLLMQTAIDQLNIDSIPLFVCRHQNLLQVMVQKTEGFIDEKEKSSLYAQVCIGKQMLETIVYKKKGDPFWGSLLSFSYNKANVIKIQIKDWKMIKTNTVLGSVDIPLFDITEDDMVIKSYPIKGSKGVLKCGVQIIKAENITNLLPIECEADDEDDDWCKQNIQPFEVFTDDVNTRGVVDTSLKDDYHFEMSEDDISNLLNEDVPIFNESYFERPLKEGVCQSVNKKVFYNDVATDKGPIMIAVGDESGGLKRAVVISQFGNVKTYVTDLKNIDNETMSVFGLKKDQVKMKECDKSVWPKLIEFEERNQCHSYKIGLLYAKQGQRTEMEFLSNTTPSPLCTEFYKLIGETVTLKGYTGYRGGLDVTSNTTGTTSIVSKYKGTEIMFHVATMLQHVEEDPQHLDKKRHIGNDVVVIIFKESNGKKDDEIDLNSFVTQFNHVFIIVTPTIVKGSPFYKVCVCCKSAVQAFLPRFPPEKLFKRDEVFKEWLLCKAINGERSSIESPQFIKSQRIARKGLLEVIINEVK